jgi:hypothetical protein
MEHLMRYLCLIRASETSGPAPQALLDALSALADRNFANGSMLDGGRLLSTAHGMRGSLRKGKMSITDGPFTEASEVIAGYAIFEHEKPETAREFLMEFLEIHQKYAPNWEGECEVREMMPRD